VSPPPATPCVYHITHVNNLPAIIANGGLISDAAIIARGGPAATIGMGTIKQRRLSLPVSCHLNAQRRCCWFAHATTAANAAHQPQISVQPSWYF